MISLISYAEIKRKVIETLVQINCFQLFGKEKRDQ